jgi:hypothetical protein
MSNVRSFGPQCDEDDKCEESAQSCNPPIVINQTAIPVDDLGSTQYTKKPVKVEVCASVPVQVTGQFYPATQPISGNVGISGTFALPTNAAQETGGNLEIIANALTGGGGGGATAANQTNGAQKTQIVDGSGNVISSTGNALNVNVENSIPISGTVIVTQSTGTNLHTVVDSGSVSVSGSVDVTQATGTNLHTVVDSGSISVSNFPATQPVSGTVTANAGTGTFTVGQATGTNLHTVVDSIGSALPAGTNFIGHVIADSGSTTAVTGNVTVIQPTGTNLHVVVDSGSITPSGTQDVNLLNVAGNPVSQGHGTAATAIRVELPTDGNGTVTANAGTNLNTSLLALESGGNLAMLVALQTATNALISALSTITPSLKTTETSRFESNDIASLLGQILIELRVHSYYLSNLPSMLNQSQPGQISDEPSSLRNDPSILM